MTKYKRINFDTGNQLFSEVMINRKIYTIPRFQRDYSWGTDNWQELWSDIEQILEKKEQHFMGSLLLQTEDGATFKIIDGQQRLTTLSIIILAIMKQLKTLINQNQDKDGNAERLENYRRIYIGVWDPVALTTTPKLVLNRDNKHHFRNMVARLDIQQYSNILRTNRQLNNAFEYFYNQVKNITNGEELARITEGIVKGLLFTVITVTDDIDAYTVFETLNVRGVGLSAPELLKNYILSTMSASNQFTDQNFDDFDKRWAGLLEQFGETKFANFLCSQQGMEAKLPHKNNLCRVLSKQLNHPGTIFPYLEKLEEAAPVYTALQNPEDEFWRTENNGQYQEAITHLKILNLFKIKTSFSLLMAGFLRFEEAKNFIKLLQYIVVMTIRYKVICQKSPNEQEQLYNKISNKVWKERLSVSGVANELESLYPKDKEFERSFVKKTESNNQKSRFLLHTIERQLSNNNPLEPPTLEHVLPQNPNNNWQEDFGKGHFKQAINRLGNMALLSQAANLKAAQDNFSEKRKILQKSPYKINKRIAKHSRWNIEELNTHQKWLAEQAKAIWKIP